MAGASRSIVIQAPIERVFQVVTDYEKYPQFLSEVKSIRLGPRTGNEVVVHYEVNVIKTIHYSLRIREDAPAKMRWTFIEGEFMKTNEGGWDLEDLGGGQTKATYSAEVTFGLLVPKTIANTLIDIQLPKMLEAFKSRIEKM